MSTHLQVEGTFTDANGHSASGYADVQVFTLPTCTVAVVGSGPIYVGDEVVVAVTGTTDAEAGPATAGLKVNGQPVTASPDGLFRFTAS